MVTDVNETLWRSFCRTYKNKSSHCTPETNIMLHFTLDVNKNKKKKKSKSIPKKKKSCKQWAKKYGMENLDCLIPRTALILNSELPPVAKFGEFSYREVWGLPTG